MRIAAKIVALLICLVWAWDTLVKLNAAIQIRSWGEIYITSLSMTLIAGVVWFIIKFDKIKQP